MSPLHKNAARATVLLGLTALALAAVHHDWLYHPQAHKGELQARASRRVSTSLSLPQRADLPAHRLAANAATSAVAAASAPAPFVGPPAPVTTITYDSGSPATVTLYSKPVSVFVGDSGPVVRSAPVSVLVGPPPDVVWSQGVSVGIMPAIAE